MVPAIDYQAIVQELKRRFTAVEEEDSDVRQVAEQMCRRMTLFLDVDPSLCLEEVILQLEDKWRAEGLIQSNGP